MSTKSQYEKNASPNTSIRATISECTKEDYRKKTNFIPRAGKKEEKKGRRKRKEGRKDSMVSREQKRAVLHEKLQLLRSVTNSHALNKTSIIVDASKYIKELKQKVERLNQDIAIAETSSQQPQLPVQVTVETLEKGFLINVFSDKSCPGLLVSILEAFEDLGLNVLEARVSCTDSFRLQAFGGENEEEGDMIDSQVIKQAVVQAVQNWSESNNDG
ncbi:hypothetical protein EUGRSUZ_G03115 [Eucalyptus grandis]|uniref:Plant bHLH transcription factor ACT-like domain-containing protein n=3 Tax=Eucalyptus TaxID=3932 RepID=A0A059BHP2_EUCGR|nr:hypothetical protein EUGRSUZ_G03115 [Eucalyptus grandis]